MPLTALEKPHGQSDPHTTGSHAYLAERNAAAKDTQALGDLNNYGLWEHMLRTNPIVALGYMGLAATMQSVEWVPEDRKGKVGKRIMRFAEDLLLERMYRRLKDVTRTMWHCVPYGVAPHEITSYQADGYTWIRDVEYRPIRTFPQSYIWKDRDGYVHATQQFHTGGDHGAIQYHEEQFGGPADWPTKGWLWWPTYGDGLLGTPLLRPIVTEHQNKEDIRRGFGISVQKILAPTPVIMARDPGDGGGPDESDVDDALDELGAAAMHEEFALSMPGWVEKIQSLFEGQDSEVITRAIEAENHADTQVLLLFGAPYMARGLMSGTGTNAAGKVDATEQRNHRRYYLDIGSSHLQYLSDFFIELNFGPQRYYPEWRAIYRQELDPLAESRAMVSYRAGGYMSASDADEDHIRAESGWPARDPDADPRQTKSATAPETPGSRDEDTGDDDRDRPTEEDEEDDR